MKKTLKNSFLTVEIETSGAEIKRVIYNGKDYMHDSNPTYWGRTAPILFPFVGCILDKYSTINGVKYPMNKHGIIRDIEFSSNQISDEEIILSLNANEETLKIYPYNFTLEIKYYLSSSTLKSEIKVINNGQTKLPFNLGLHPAFKVPLEENEKFEDYHLEFPTSRTYEIPVVNLENGTIDFTTRYTTLYNLKKLPLNYNDYKNDAIVLENIDFNKVILTNKTKSHGVEFKFDKFPMLGIWTPNTIDSPFICIEPWIGCADRPDTNHNFLEKRDLVYVSKNASKTIKYQFKFF